MTAKALVFFAMLCFVVTRSSAEENINDIIARVHNDYTIIYNQVNKDNSSDYARAYAVERTANGIERNLAAFIYDLDHGGSVKMDMDSFWQANSFLRVVLFSASGEAGWQNSSAVALLHIAEKSMQQDQIELKIFSVSVLFHMLEANYARDASLESWAHFSIISNNAIHHLEQGMLKVESDGVRLACQKALTMFKDIRLKSEHKSGVNVPPNSFQKQDDEQASPDQRRIQQYQMNILNRDLGFVRGTGADCGFEHTGTTNIVERTDGEKLPSDAEPQARKP